MLFSCEFLLNKQPTGPSGRFCFVRRLAVCAPITDNPHMIKRDSTLAQRQAAARQRLIDEGGRRVTLAVPGDLNARLQAEMDRTGESANSVILRLMRDSLPR